MNAFAKKIAKEATDSANKIAAALQASVDSQDDSAPLTEQEQAEVDAARNKAIGQVGNAIRMVQAQLAGVNSQVTGRVSATHGLFGIRGKKSGTDAADKIAVPVSASEIDDVTESLEDMIKSASNVIDDFDEILEKPFLEEFSASLDRVPLIGIQDRKLMYSKNVLIDDNASTVFAEFAELPNDAPKDISSANVFPRNGNLYLSIGTSVWWKEDLKGNNDALADSIDNWPLIFKDGWSKIGDNVFSADIVDAAYYGQVPDSLHPTRKRLFRTVLLDSSGQLHTFGGTLNRSGNTFVPIAFKPSDDVKEAPVWEKIAFTRGDLHAYANGIIWTLALSLSEATGTYTVRDKTTVGNVLEMEGNETGLVLRRDDGFLYQQYIQVSDPEIAPVGDFLYQHPEAASGDPTLVALAYTRWIKAPSDLRMIGVAVPGVELNLRILTSSLKSRYLRTQTALYPVVEKIRAFAKVHTAYLDYLQTEADKYSATNPPTDDEAIAQANTYLGHISFWTKTISDAITGVMGAVNVMAASAEAVKRQLKTQLAVMEKALVKLEAALRGLQTAKKGLRKKLNDAVGLIVGGALSFLAPPLAYPLIGAKRNAVKKELAQVNKDLANTEARLKVLTTTHGKLSQIPGLYDDGIDGALEALNTFWGRMFNNAGSLQTMTGALSDFGAELLLGSFSFNITAAKKSVDLLSVGCTKYLDLLNSQGVQVGLTRSVATARALVQELPTEEKFDPKASKPGPISEVELDSDRDSFSRAATHGLKLLQARNVDSYLKHLEQEVVPSGKITATVL
ncbi:unnamed protein product [Pylaiella littoralis]